MIEQVELDASQASAPLRRFLSADKVIAKVTLTSNSNRVTKIRLFGKEHDCTSYFFYQLKDLVQEARG